MYEDKTLVCKECGKEFVFTAGEQEFYAERGFQNEPQRCKACRDARKNAARGPREYFTAVCAACAARPAFPSSRSLTAPCTAASASPRCGSSRDNDHSFLSLAERTAGTFSGVSAVCSFRRIDGKTHLHLTAPCPGPE